MAGGFLKRWSRRKSGEQVEPEKGLADDAKQEIISQPKAEGVLPESSETPAPMTLDDVEKIDRLAPDFSAFMKPGVDPAVQQAAMKKMFSDPHFNVMDGLDIYIDDYSKPDPIPLEMLKRMVQSDTLNIFRKGSGDASEPAEAGEIGKEIAADLPEAKELTLPSMGQTDLTSPHPIPDLRLEDQDSIPVDKKTS